MGNSVESLTKINATTVFIHEATYLILEGYQVGQAPFSLHKYMLTTPNHLVVLPLPGNGFQE